MFHVLSFWFVTFGGRVIALLAEGSLLAAWVSLLISPGFLLRGGLADCVYLLPGEKFFEKRLGRKVGPVPRCPKRVCYF